MTESREIKIPSDMRVPTGVNIVRSEIVPAKGTDRVYFVLVADTSYGQRRVLVEVETGRTSISRREWKFALAKISAEPEQSGSLGSE